MLSESIYIKIGLFQLLKNALHGLSVQSLDDRPDDVTTETIVQLTMTFQWPNQHPVKKWRFYQQFNQRKNLPKKTQIKKMTGDAQYKCGIHERLV